MTYRPSQTGRRFDGGATLVELVAVMAIIGIIAAVAGIAIREPLQSYADSSRRAELTDAADTAVRRIGRDVRLALPNSIRTTIAAGTTYLEFLPIRTGGRYRVTDIGVAQADPLDFSTPDVSFNMLGAPSAVAGQTVVTGQDIVVVRNENATAARSNAYTYNQNDALGGTYNCTVPAGVNCNTALIQAGPTSVLAGNEFKLTLAAQRVFNYDTGSDRGFGSPGNRFYVITNSPVSYVCAPNNVLNADGDATGTLTRIGNYAIQFAQPTAFGVGASSALLAGNVSACTIAYDNAALGSNGLVAIRLELTRGNERVNLYYEVHVNNAP